MTASVWVMILMFSNGVIFNYSYQTMPQCQTAGRYALSLPAKHKIHPVEYYCIPGDYHETN